MKHVTVKLLMNPFEFESPVQMTIHFENELIATITTTEQIEEFDIDNNPDFKALVASYVGNENFFFTTIRETLILQEGAGVVN